MLILKRNGSKVEFDPNKILRRLAVQAKDLKVDHIMIAIQVQSLLHEGISSLQIDMEAARIAASYIATHSDYNIFAARLVVSRLHKQLGSDWKDRVGELLNDELLKKADEWNISIAYHSDYYFDYLGIQTFMNVYGLKKKGEGDKKVLVELPCEMYYRVALELSDSKEEALTLYEALCEKKISLATPILLNAGTHSNCLISCSLNTLEDDSLRGIHNTLYNIARQSSDSAGIGIWASNLRSRKSPYRNRGKAGGVTRFAKMVNNELNFFQQSEERRGAAAFYLDLWHRDVMDMLSWRKQETSEELACRDLFPAIVMPDLFYKRLIEDSESMWSFFCPDQIEKAMDFNLYDVWGEEFEKRYIACEQNEAIPRDTMSCKQIITEICVSQTETGTPYIWNKDNVNRSYNQSNYGVAKTSNLCIEIINFSDKDNAGQCDLGAIPVMNYVKYGQLDFSIMADNVQILTRALNKVIDKHQYSTTEAERAGLSQRSIGIGIAGLADLAFKLDLPYTSAEFRVINQQISEVMYYNAVKESSNIAKEFVQSLDRGDSPRPDTTFFKKINETPLAKDLKFHFEHYNPDTYLPNRIIPQVYWDDLRKQIQEYGVFNTLFLANMPTASTSSLLSCRESFPPAQDLALVRRVGTGEFIIFDKYLIKDLEDLGIWCQQLAEEIMQKESLVDIDLRKYREIKEFDFSGVETKKFNARCNHLKEKYKTIWEIPMRDYIDMAADRQVYIDQSQSMDLYWSKGVLSKMISALIYGWQKGLKTGVYYTRVKKSTENDKNLSFNFASEPVKTKPQNSNYECFNCSV